MAARASTAASSSSHGHHPGDEPEPVGLVGLDPAPGHHELERPFRGQPLKEDDGHHVGPDADVDLRRAEDGVVGRDDEVTGEGEAHAAGEGVPLHAGDRRLAEGGQILEDLRQLTARPRAGRPGSARWRLPAAGGGRVRPDEVRSGGEGPVPGPGEDHHPYLLVGAGSGEGRTGDRPARTS